MPLRQRVIFKTMLQKKDRLQVSKLVRSQYELVDSEALKVDVSVVGL